MTGQKGHQRQTHTLLSARVRICVYVCLSLIIPVYIYFIYI